MSDPTPPPQISPDGKFYWDGQKWVAMDPAAPTQLVQQPPPTSVLVYGPRTNSLAVGRHELA